MTAPLDYCHFVKALDGDSLSLQLLISDVKYNRYWNRLRSGKGSKEIYSVYYSCRHNPPCRKLTQTEYDTVWKRINMLIDVEEVLKSKGFGLIEDKIQEIHDEESKA